jgi:hypothetical protein
VEVRGKPSRGQAQRRQPLERLGSERVEPSASRRAAPAAFQGKRRIISRNAHPGELEHRARLGDV